MPTSGRARYVDEMRTLRLLGLLSLLSAQVGAACPEDPDALNRKGRELAAKERWADAEKTFATLSECKPSPTSFLSLAITQMELGRLVAARKSAEKARSLAVAARQPLAAFDDKLREIDAALPRVVLRMTSGVRDVHPRVDGIEVGLVNGTEILVDPGEHKLVVRAEGRPAFETKVVVAKGSVIDLRVDFGEEGPPAQKSAAGGGGDGAPKERSPAPPGASKGGPIVLGILGAGVFVGAGLRYLNRDAFYADAKVPPHTDEEVNTAGRERYVWGALAGVGAGMVAGAVVWWAALPSTDAQVAAVPLPGGAGLVGNGRF